jgi:hypothetical protein
MHFGSFVICSQQEYHYEGLGGNNKTDTCTFWVGTYPWQEPVFTCKPLVFIWRETVFTCIDWFCELCRVCFASKNASCLQDYSNTKWTLYLRHQCDELCSKALLKELLAMCTHCMHTRDTKSMRVRDSHYLVYQLDSK